VQYHWLEALGGRRHRKKTDPPSPNPGLRDQNLRNSADYMATDEFQQGVAKLLAIAGNRRTAIMCADAKIDSGTVTYPAPPTLFDVEFRQGLPEPRTRAGESHD
jgi:hypothetical protein